MRERRRALLAFLLAPALARAEARPEAAPGRGYSADFVALWRAIDSGYAYFGGSRRSWRLARERWSGPASSARTAREFALAASSALAELHDDRIEVEIDGEPIARRVPADTDVWAEWSGEEASITAVRASSVADVAGLHPGQVVLHVQGVPIERVVATSLGAGPRDAAGRDWALRRVLAGPRNGPLVVGVREPGGALRRIELTRAMEPAGSGPPLVARRVGEERNLGFIRIKNNLGEATTLMHFDAALQHLKDTRGLLLDLRETQAGGSDAVVAAILGRFIAAPAAWQVREAPGRSPVTDVASPRGNFAYHAPRVVLVDRWTAAEGESLAAGLQSSGATLVGTAMAGLHGRAGEVALPRSGVVVRFPAERTLTAARLPREALRPDIAVDLLAPSGGPGDPILYQGLKVLEARTKQAAT